MQSPVGPIGFELDRSKLKRFAAIALKRFALSLAGAVGAKLGERIVDSLFANDEDEDDDEEKEE